jgi:prepilin-type N-terminal cleavage/methylation domain-containing protein
MAAAAGGSKLFGVDKAKGANMRRRGFTLTEMLVVIGIVVLLLSLLSPMVTRAWKAGDRTRTAADLQAIASAQEAYKADHCTYPMPTLAAGIPSAPDRPNPPTGAQLLCFTIVAPAPAKEPGYSPTVSRRWKQDGADGPGFRTRGFDGRVYGPYLPADRFKLANPDNPTDTNPLTLAILDRYNRPILYYPARGRPNIRVTNGFVKDWDYLAPPAPKYNVRDNPGAMDERTMRVMLGDTNANGMIDAGETPKAEADFLLWSAGPDETFGPPQGMPLNTPENVRKAVEKSDDVTNFNS